MAEEVAYDMGETPQNTSYYSQDGSIDKMQILTASGQKIDVKK